MKNMKAIQYLDELIEFEENYQTGYTSIGDKVPKDSIKRWKDLKRAKKEVLQSYSKEKVIELCKSSFKAGSKHIATEGKIYGQSDSIDDWLNKNI